MIKFDLFLGKSVFDLSLSKKSITFKEFSKGLSEPKIVDISTKKYQALMDLEYNGTSPNEKANAKKERFKYKNAEYYVNCTFEPPVRRDANSQFVSLISIDIDKPEHGVLIDEFYLDTLLSDFNYLAYTTLSSTPEKPRWRVVVEADGEIPSTLYKAASKTLAAILNLENLTSESFVPSQAMYVSQTTTDGCFEYLEGLSGSSFTIDDIRPEERSESPLIRPSAQDSDLSSLYNLEPKIDLPLGSANEALSYLDPDMSRSEWLTVAAGLKHEYGGTDDEEQAFHTFDSWSSQGSKYEGTEDAAKMWESLKADPDRAPITAKSLLFKAKESGWKGSVAADQSEIEIERFKQLVEECTDQKILTTEIPKEISISKLNSIDREIIVTILRNQIKAITGSTIAINIVRNMCAQRSDESMVYETDEGFLSNLDTKIPDWVKPYCYIKNSDEFYNMITKQRYSPEVFDSVCSRYLLTIEEKLEGAARPSIRPRDFALNLANIPQHDSYTFYPGLGEVVEVDGLTCMNTYEDKSPPSSEVNMEEVKAIILEHIKVLTSTDGEYHVLLDYLAYIVQNIGKKIRWTILIQGVQGCGKTVISDMMAAVLGPGACGLVDGSTLDSNYSDWANNKLYITMEEVRVSGTNKHKVMGMLKPFLTNDIVCINQRYKDSYTIPNVANYLLLTNHKDSLPIDATDRRYSILYSALQEKWQVKELQKKGHFTRLFKVIKENPGTIKKFFLDYPIRKSFNPNNAAPIFKANEIMASVTKPELQVVIEDMVEDGYPGVTDLICSSTMITRGLKDDFTDYEAQYSSNSNISRTLLEMGYVKVNGRTKLNGITHSFWAKHNPDLKLKEASQLYEFLMED